MWDNKVIHNKEINQGEAPTNAFDVLIELYKHRQELVTGIVLKYTSPTMIKDGREQLEALDEHIDHLKLIATDNYDPEEEA